MLTGDRLLFFMIVKKHFQDWNTVYPALWIISLKKDFDLKKFSELIGKLRVGENYYGKSRENQYILGFIKS
jgi:hypothetical protein